MEENLSWSVMEYHEKDRTVDWYWTVGIVTLLVIIGCFYFGDYLLGILILIGVGTLTYLTFRKPELVTVEISKSGVRIRNDLYSYRTLKAFWIEQNPPAGHDTHLLLLTTRFYSPVLAVPIDDVAPEVIREALLPHLEEKEMQENPSHHFIEMLGF